MNWGKGGCEQTEGHRTLNSSLPPSRGETKRGVGAASVAPVLARGFPPPTEPPPFERGGMNWGKGGCEQTEGHRILNSSLPPSRGETKRGSALRASRRWLLAASHFPPNLPPQGGGMNWGRTWLRRFLRVAQRFYWWSSFGDALLPMLQSSIPPSSPHSSAMSSVATAPVSSSSGTASSSSRCSPVSASVAKSSQLL